MLKNSEWCEVCENHKDPTEYLCTTCITRHRKPPTKFVKKEDSEICYWCHKSNGKPMNQSEVEWGVIDDDFAQPVPANLVKYCFSCGRKIYKEGVKSQ